ncbi:MAG: TonB-dependent receptor [Candidatus Kapaibacterium sp.]|nr:MAG: TonB-dependent receptor [Candidatus Kapabacteria bacterium]
MQFLATSLVLLLLLASTSLVAQAQSNAKKDSVVSDNLERLSLEDLMNVEIISATKIAQRPIEAPSIVSLITPQQIREYGWISLNDVLYAQPGFSPSQDFDRRTVSARGMYEGWNNNHLLMLIDGIPFNDNLYGTAFTSEITPLFLAKSLEIIRGPGSALYGSNATNGVIGINTISANDTASFSGEAQARVGTLGTQVYDVVVGSSQEMFSAVLGYNAFATSGYEYLSYDGSLRRTPQGALRQFTTNDARNSSYLFAKIEGKKALEGLSLQFHDQRWQFETGHGWLWNIPDVGESMQEARRILALSYKPKSTGDLSIEAALRYQNRTIDWNIRFFPDSTSFGGILYPRGVSESIATNADDLFARFQLIYKLPEQANIIAAAEGTVFWYDGDKNHTSNINLAGDFLPFAGNALRTIPSFLQWIEGNPMLNLGVFAQFSSGKLFGDKLSATLGVRYDNQSFQFNALDKTGLPKESLSFSALSPRLGVVFLADRDFSVKFLAGRAFRAPAPTELFGANTFALASNIRNLKPEFITTVELGTDWIINKTINWRLNGFYTNFENQIAYSVANANLSTNVYTLVTAGIETEINMSFDRFSGFVNYSFAARLGETILDNTIQASNNQVTWVPAHTLNLGATYRAERFTAALTAHLQGETLRRQSDRTTPEFTRLRPNSLPAWFTVDARLAYQITETLELSLLGNNLLDTQGMMMKNFDYPFDYRIGGRRIIASMRLQLR